jgi:hypothetical protein
MYFQITWTIQLPGGRDGGVVTSVKGKECGDSVYETNKIDRVPGI